MQSFFSHKYAIPATLLLVLAATLAFGAQAYKTLTAEDQWNRSMTISVSGMGEVMAVPDVADFSFSVRGEGADATIAQNESATRINAIMAFLKEQGIEEKDIKTANYSLFPKYRYEQRPCTFNFCPPGEQIADGFEVSQTITVKVRDTAKAGELLSGVGNAGATDISGLFFSIDNPDELKAQARAEAVADAKEQAKILAETLGVKIDGLIGYNENDNSMPMPYYGMGGDMMAKSEMAVTPDVPTGESTITSRVTLTYRIR